MLQTIYEFASCVRIPRAIGAFYHVWMWHNVQRARSEMRRCKTHALYRSKLWQQDHCQHPENANLDGSTLECTAQRIGRPFGGGGAEVHRQEDPDQRVLRKGPGNHWWNSPADYSADCQRFRRLTHNCECMCEKEDLKCRYYRRQTSQILSEKTKNLRLIKSIRSPSSPDLNPLDYFVWSYVENITNMTSHNTKASLIVAINRVFAELPPVLVVKACSHSGSVSRFWLKLKAATLNRCQLYYIIKLPELIFSIKVLK